MDGRSPVSWSLLLSGALGLAACLEAPPPVADEPPGPVAGPPEHPVAGPAPEGEAEPGRDGGEEEEGEEEEQREEEEGGEEEEERPRRLGDALAPLGEVRPVRAGGRRGPIHIMDVLLVGETAYLATYSGAFAVDVRDPGAPSQIGDPIGQKLYWLAASDAGLLTAGRDDGMRLLVVGLSGGWEEQAGRSGESFTPEGVAVAGERVYVAGQEQGLLIHDLFDLRQVAAWDGAHNAIDVVVQAGVAYVGDRERGVVIAAVSQAADALEITELAAVPLPGGLVQHLELSPDGRHLYVAAGARVAVLDVSEPAQARVVAELHPGGVATGVAADGDLLALANWRDTRLYDVADPAAPRLIAVEDALDASMSVDLRGDLLVVGDWDHLRAYRIDATLQAAELELPKSVTVLGDPAVTAEVETYVLVGNGTSDDVDLELFDVTCASDAVAPAVTEATVAPGLVAVVPLRVDIVVGGGRRPEREWRTSCAFWTTDPDESIAEVEVVVNPDGLSLGDPAPDWTLPDLDGELHTLSAHRGKVVVMTIFSSL